MKGKIQVSLLLVILFSLLACDQEPPAPLVDEGLAKPVTKTNTMKVYMHYMPWFQAKSVSGIWGSHWKMNNKNPDIVDENGKRQIASHYYPLIGPYDSRDPDVVKYHLLLMKYAGIDGVLIDWYGTHNINDYRVNLLGAETLIDQTDDVGLQYGIVYEEYTAGVVQDKTSKTAIAAAQADMDYMAANYFSQDNYIKINKKPLLMTFGPRFFKQESQWLQIFNKHMPVFLPLWNHTSYTGSTDNGEFSWIDFTEQLSNLSTFYNRRHFIPVLMGSAYPRFHDFYAEGGTGTSYGYVPSNDGQTLSNTLELASQKQLEYLQLATWNDYGEGTVFEPTLEDGFSFLERVQQFTGVEYDKDELELIHTYYLKTQQYKSDATAQEILKTVFNHLIALEVEQAVQLLSQLE